MMKDMSVAVDRLLKAFHHHEKILIYGDYDVDGTTSVALLFHYLCSIYHKEQVDFYIPNRYKEGYGLSEAGIQYAIQENVNLLICIDCGIKSNDLIALANNHAIDTIICDHHLPGEALPPAHAILNPKQSDCPYPFKELCGCGIGFKLVQALQSKLNPDSDHHFRYLDWVAVAIAADIVPMTGENRILAFLGLKKLNEHPSIGIKAMLDVAGHVKKVSISNVVFIIAPRINAAGRMDDAKKVVRLLLNESYESAKEQAIELQSDNTDRREIESEQTKEALSMLANDPAFLQKKSTVIHAPHWLKGVIGIMASRLQDHYYRPTIVLTEQDGKLSGSARSIPGFNICEGISACSDVLIQFGGHAAAAGLTLSAENLPAFKEKFESVVAHHVTDEMLQKKILIDVPLQFKEINMRFYDVLNQMQPFGPDNMNPIFVSYGVQCCNTPQKMKEKHIRLNCKQNDVTFTCVGFGLAHTFDSLAYNKMYDIVYHIELNEYNGNTSLQLHLLDIRLSEIV
jgi:single-stranded-DNA-specific exonuclease